MEKRLGAAQLLLLVAVLVFIGLTRGSRGEPIRLSRASAAWHRGIQSSGEWVSGWRGTRVFAPGIFGQKYIVALALTVLLDEFTNVDPHKGADSPTLQPRLPLIQRSSSVGLDPIDHLHRRNSSQSALRQETNYDDLLRTSRLLRNPTRSRRSSQHSRSRNHTPTRRLLQLPKVSDPMPGQETQEHKPARPLSMSNTNASGAGPTYQKGHKRTNSGGAGGYWRVGRSISLSSAKGLGTGLFLGKAIGPTRRLAKTAHMHEVRPVRAGSTGTDSSYGRERSRTLADELHGGSSLSMLSPMTENPNSAGMVGFGDTEPRRSRPVRVGGFDAEVGNTQPAGVLSGMSGSQFVATSSPELGTSGGRDSVLGVPFPSPALNGERDSEENGWVDDSGDEECISGSGTR